MTMNILKLTMVAMITCATHTVNAQEYLGADWSGNVNGGLSIASGNSDTSALNGDANLGARWEDQRAGIKADFNQEESNDVDTVDNRSISGTYDYFFAPKWFWNVTGGLETDEIALLDLRSTASTGLGYQVFESDDLNLKFVAGPGYIDEDFSTGVGESSATGHWALDYDQKFYDDLFRVFHNHTLLTPFEDITGAYIFNSKTGIRLPVRAGIIATAELDLDHDSDPVVGANSTDRVYSLKLGYEW